MCITPSWDRFDPRKVPLRNLKRVADFYKNKVNTVREYLKLREAHRKNTFNAELILEYYEEKHKLVYKVAERIKKLTTERKKTDL